MAAFHSEQRRRFLKNSASHAKPHSPTDTVLSLLMELQNITPKSAVERRRFRKKLTVSVLTCNTVDCAHASPQVCHVFVRLNPAPREAVSAGTAGFAGFFVL